MERLTFVNLNDVFVSREEYGKLVRKMNRRISRENATVFWTWFMIGSLFMVVREQAKHIYKLEKKNETAG